MDLKLSLSEYKSILGGMKHDVRQSFLAHFAPPKNTFADIDTEIPSDRKFSILQIETMTAFISADLDLPFKVDSGSRIVRSNGTRIVITVQRRTSNLDAWKRDATIGDTGDGVMIINALSLDEPGADEAGKTAAAFVAKLLEPMLEPA